ncbi:hypothetical protein [Longimicrobium sp.]|uniref:hypothetical protein n=1 Tax=Longimicrobium sp. TaxID=2029185 RepID=UPI002D0859E4|nr:hypothetical protein [Longimicrobium sp.]HSU16670.1 hypothetical protein [Longimicrobium sp.]
MPTVCPECASPVAAGAAVCPQCGFPLRDAAPAFGGGPARPAPSGSKVVYWVLGIAAAGVILMVVLGVAAALVIPRLQRAGGEARSSEREADAMLERAWTLQQVYLVQHGSYAPDVEDLRGVGWDPPESTGVGLTVVTWAQHNLCMEATSGGTVRSIRNDGTLVEGRCAPEATDFNAAAQARLVLQDGWRLLNAYRETHGTLPPTLAEIEPKIGQREALASVRLGYQRYANGEFCLSLRPKGVVGPERSVDQDGRFFGGSACSGRVIESFAYGARARSGG